MQTQKLLYHKILFSPKGVSLISSTDANSSAALFTSCTNQHRLELDVNVDGVQIATINNPKLLEVTFDILQPSLQYGCSCH